MTRLEAFSLTTFLYSILGTKEQHLAKENQEYLTVKLKYDESVQAATTAREKVRFLQDELAKFERAEIEYQALIQEKEKYLFDVGDDQAERLLILSEELADLRCERKELQAAIQAGEATLKSLQQVSSDLQSAANWGTWDMLGGGMVATLAKHTGIDSARRHTQQAQQHLRRFQTELVDVGQRFSISLDISEFSKFADFFFDGLITDWLIQSKIQQGLSACADAMARVTVAMGMCHIRLTETQENIESAKNSRLALIEQS
ncbi:MAG: hypothetical protein KTR27_19245 [Leptolyngbyaceae cyanobacterium MAG.088]|nr:hypothetical protein [Leptolyngbyaceae cyanobacterium MAG.088]